jgi:hypothetical protein
MSPTYTKRIEAARKQEDARLKREEQERTAAAARRAAERAVQEKTARLRALRMAKKAEKPSQE